MNDRDFNSEPSTLSHVEPTGEQSGDTIGPYKLLQSIGEGGMGIVYMAEQSTPVERRVALKIIKPGMDSRQVIARFEAERQALAMMDHPNIAKVLDAGSTENGLPYFVMELVKGIPITRYCDDKALPTRSRLELFASVCRAVQHAHHKGIIHRDLKPSNVLIAQYDGRPVVKVIDFGVAKATSAKLTDKTMFTQFGQIVGTFAYMSPEQAEFNQLDIDTRSDIYSLGVLLYEMISGKTPFEKERLQTAALQDLIRIIREEDPPRPSARIRSSENLASVAASRSVDPKRLCALVKGDLDWIVMKAMEEDRSRRYETANALARDVERHLANEPVSAVKPGTTYLVRRFIRRHRLLVAASASVVAVLLIGLFISIWQFLEKNSALRRVRLSESEQSRLREVAENRLHNSLVREIQLIRRGRELGFRQRVENRIQQALGLDLPDHQIATMRRELFQCLGDPLGLAPVALDKSPPNTLLLAAAINAQDTIVAFSTRDQHLILHDAVSGRLLNRMPQPENVSSLAFSSSEPKLYAVRGKELVAWRPTGVGDWTENDVPFTSDVLKVMACRDGTVVICRDETNDQIALHNVETGQRIGQLPGELIPADGMEAWPIEIASNLSLVALPLANTNNTSRFAVWDLEKGKPGLQLDPSLGPIIGFSFSHDAKLLACTSQDGVVVYATDNWQPVHTILGFYTQSSVFGLSDILAIQMYHEQSFRFINVLNDQELTRGLVIGSNPFVKFSNAGLTFLAVGDQAQVIRMEHPDGVVRLRGHVGGVTDAKFTPDGNQVITTGKDHSVRLWNVSNGRQEQVWSDLAGPGQSVAVEPGGKWFVVSQFDNNRILIRSRNTGNVLWSFGDEAPGSGQTWCCGLSPDGRYLAAVGDGLRLWKIHDDQQIPPSIRVDQVLAISGNFCNLQFDSSSLRFAVGCRESDELERKGLHVFTIDAGAKPRFLSPGGTGYGALTYAPDDDAFVLMPEGNRFEFWAAATDSRIRTRKISAEDDFAGKNLQMVQTSPDGTKIAAISHSMTGVHIYDSKTAELLYTLPNEPGAVWWLEWHPDSHRLATTRINGGVSIWDLRVIDGVMKKVGLAGK